MNSPGGPPPAPRPALRLSVQYASDAEPLPTRAQLRRWAQAALVQPARITLRLVDEPEGQRLNREFRQKDYATNVLTFVYGGTPLAGDIVLCAPVVAREAAEQNLPLEARYAHLVVHGVLHLQGYDHETDDEAAAMEALESRLVAALGYADPY